MELIGPNYFSFTYTITIQIAKKTQLVGMKAIRNSIRRKTFEAIFFDGFQALDR